jgi:hypothetical protein
MKSFASVDHHHEAANTLVVTPDTADKLTPGLGTGDCELLMDVMSEDFAATMFENLLREVNFQEMSQSGGIVPRLVAIQGIMHSDTGLEPIYRHPTDSDMKLAAMTPTVFQIKQRLEELVSGQIFNHVLIQLYRTGRDHINEHSDKTLDILHGSNIVNFSVGSARTFQLKLKKDSSLQRDPAIIPLQKIVLVNNSAFVCSWMTNAHFMHGIRPDKRDEQFKRDEELLQSGMRISLTYRSIATYSYRGEESDLLFGQGAKHKLIPSSLSELQQFITSYSEEVKVHDDETEDEESLRMLQAFSKENHHADFDWDAYYSRGFDLVCVSINRPALLVDEPSPAAVAESASGP